MYMRLVAGVGLCMCIYVYMYACLSPSWPKDQMILYVCILYTHYTEVTIIIRSWVNVYVAVPDRIQILC